MNNNKCRWCNQGMNDYNHSLCKAWFIFRFKDFIDKLEDVLIVFYNFVDDLEELDDVY